MNRWFVRPLASAGRTCTINMIEIAVSETTNTKLAFQLRLADIYDLV